MQYCQWDAAHQESSTMVTMDPVLYLIGGENIQVSGAIKELIIGSMITHLADWKYERDSRHGF